MHVSMLALFGVSTPFPLWLPGWLPLLQVLELMGASLAATYFIRQALTKRPEARPTAQQLLAHPWLLQHCGGQPLESSRFAA